MYSLIIQKGDDGMADEKKYVDAEEVAREWGISKSHAYKLIQKMNGQIHEKYPDAIIVKGKVSRSYYDYCCLSDIGNNALAEL